MLKSFQTTSEFYLRTYSGRLGMLGVAMAHSRDDADEIIHQMKSRHLKRGRPLNQIITMPLSDIPETNLRSLESSNLQASSGDATGEEVSSKSGQK